MLNWNHIHHSAIQKGILKFQFIFSFSCKASIMWKSKILAVFLIVTVACSPCSTARCHNTVASHYEEKVTYSWNPQCKPSNLDKGIKCCDVGSSIQIAGGLVSIIFCIFIQLPEVLRLTTLLSLLSLTKRLIDSSIMLVISH